MQGQAQREQAADAADGHHQRHRQHAGQRQPADRQAGQAAEAELPGHRHRRSRPGLSGIQRQQAGDAVGAEQAGDADEAQQAGHQRPQPAPLAERRIAEEEQPGHAAQQAAGPQQRPRTVAAHQARAAPGGEHHAEDVQAEEPAEALRAHAEMLDEHEGRGADVGEHPGERQPHAQHVAQRATVAEQPPIGEKGLGQAAAAALRRVAFGDPPDRQQAEPGEQRQDHEQRAPAGPEHQVAAEQRRGQRCQHGHHVHQCQHPGGLAQRIEVAHHGPSQHRRGAAAEGLEHPQQDQLPRAVGQRAGQAAEQVQGDTGQQHRAPAETVGQGAVEQHADAEADQEAADAPLHLGIAGAEIGGDRRQARQVHVDRQRAERHQRRQQQQQASFAASDLNPRCTRRHARPPLLRLSVQTTPPCTRMQVRRPGNPRAATSFTLAARGPGSFRGPTTLTE